RYPPGAELWTPLVPVIPDVVAKENVCWATLIGRLAPGTTRAQAADEFDAITSEQLRIHAPSAPAVKVVLTPLAHEWFGASRPALLVLLGAVLLVLLLACANVSALLLGAPRPGPPPVFIRPLWGPVGLDWTLRVEG